MVNYTWSIISVLLKPENFIEPRVHQLFRTKDGWLVAAPFATDGETLKEDGYSGDEIQGTFYLVNHGTDISDRYINRRGFNLMQTEQLPEKNWKANGKQKKAHHILM